VRFRVAGDTSKFKFSKSTVRLSKTLGVWNFGQMPFLEIFLLRHANPTIAPVKVTVPLVGRPLPVINIEKRRLASNIGPQ